jgi:chemotaxis protein MotA
MKAATPIGIAIAAVGLLGGAMMEGTPLGSLLNIPAILIIFGGLLGVSLASNGIEGMKQWAPLYKKAFAADRPDLAQHVKLLVGHAERARKDGLLALEEEVEKLDDEFTRKGLQLVVDGTDPKVVQEVLEAEIDGMVSRHAANSKIFENAAGFAPTLGVVGTVMGLISVLQKLDNPSVLGHAIAGAFVATFFGVASANVVFLPVALRLKELSTLEVEARMLVMEGVLAIQAGDNPRVVAEKLQSFVPPAARGGDDDAPVLRAVDGDAAAQAA